MGAEPGLNHVPAIVLGGRYSALGVVRSLGRAKLPVIVVAGRSDFAVWSRWGRRLPLAASEGGGPDELAAALESLSLERAVLFPCSDLWAEAVNRLPGAVTTRFVPAVPPGRAVEILLDKWLLAEEAVRLGLPHPETSRIASAADLTRLDADVRSFLLKPRSSQRFHHAYRLKAFPVTSREDAEAKVEAAAKLGIELLLQERIPGPPPSHVLVDGYVDRNGEVAALLARRRVRAYPPDLGDSTTVISIPLADVAEAGDVTRRLLEGIGHRGMFSACFKQDARDGRHTLIEVNCRPWSHLGFTAGCGVDVALMAYNEALGRPPPRPSAYRVGVRGTSFIPELAALRGERHEEGLARLDLGRGILRAARPNGPLDPLPGVAHAAATIGQALRRRFSRG